MEKTYDSLDRATMATWRASNFLGWGAVALGSALVLHTVFDEISQRIRIPGFFGTLNARPLHTFGTWQSIAPIYGYHGFCAIVIGVLIGSIVGTKMRKSQTKMSAAIAGAYVLISWFLLEFSYHLVVRPQEGGISSTIAEPRNGLPSGALEWSYSLMALLAIPVAALVARVLAKRRSAEPATTRTLG